MTLKQYLKDRKQNRFAEKVGISSSHLTLILKGKRKPSLKLVNRILQGTDCEVTVKELRPDIYKDVMRHSARAED